MIQFVWLAHSPLVNIAYLLFRYRLDEVKARRTEYKCLADPRLKERFFRGAKGDYVDKLGNPVIGQTRGRTTGTRIKHQF